MLKRLSGLLTLVMFAFVAMSSTAHARSPAEIAYHVTQEASDCHETEAEAVKTHISAKPEPAKSAPDCADSCDCALTHCPATTGLLGSPLLGEAPMTYGRILALPKRDDSRLHGRMVDAPERPPRA